MGTIALEVPADLRRPVGGVVPGLKPDEPGIQIPPVPVVAIAEDDDLGAAEHDVGGPRQARVVQPVP